MLSFRAILYLFLFGVFCFGAATCARAQGGPPYYTTDPGTPGNFNWEVNFGYMPFNFSDNSITHVPDVDINFGIGDRIQLTYENAWLRVRPSASSSSKYGLGQSNAGVKWRFLDHGENSLNISIFPQVFVNNPNDAVRRGITPQSQSLLLPMEFSKKVGPVDVNLEVGYSLVHKGSNGWLTGLVVGRDVTKKLELDAEFYSQGAFEGDFHPSNAQPVLDGGLRYKLHRPFILLLMAGRSVQAASPNQPYFVGYFGVQVLLPARAWPTD